MISGGALTVGGLSVLLSYANQYMKPFNDISSVITEMQNALACANRIFDLLEEEEESPDVEGTINEVKGNVSISHVDFSYDKNHRLIEDFNLEVDPGMRIAIVGPTGCGKTTFINLLMRFYDADAGEIRIGGRRIEGIPEEELHTMFGVVFQNDFILADSIRENIDFGRGLSDEALLLAARLAQAEFIEEKEGGLSHMLTAKGANLSGGQKQRLLIARALAAKPEILVLDDCSSALDYKTDKALRSALYHNFADTTTVIIAQRISSILNADHILVLDGGRVIGAGTHEQLLETCPDYREIYDVQMGEVG